MKTYHFTVTLAGTGIDEEGAWQDACEAFALENGDAPEAELVEETED